MLSRRSCLRLGLWGALAPLAGCSGGRSSDAAGTSGAGAGTPAGAQDGATSRDLATPLSTITLTAPAGESASWQPEVKAAAEVVDRVWGGGRPIAVTVCDDAAFDAISDGLDSGTAAVTTHAGVFLGPALLRSVTPLGRTVVIAHELTHARLGQAGADRAQWWLEEGAAEWTAAGVAPRLTSAQRWPTLRQALLHHEVSDGPPTQAAGDGSQLAYEWAHAYVTYLVAESSAEQVKALVRSRPQNATAQARRLTEHRESFLRWLAQRFDAG